MRRLMERRLGAGGLAMTMAGILFPGGPDNGPHCPKKLAAREWLGDQLAHAERARRPARTVDTGTELRRNRDDRSAWMRLLYGPHDICAGVPRHVQIDNHQIRALRDHGIAGRGEPFRE